MTEFDHGTMRTVVERLQRLAEDYWWTLDPTCRLMRGEAWLGPAGDRFVADVHAHQSDLRDALDDAVRSARDALPSPPSPPSPPDAPDTSHSPGTPPAPDVAGSR